MFSSRWTNALFGRKSGLVKSVWRPEKSPPICVGALLAAGCPYDGKRQGEGQFQGEGRGSDPHRSFCRPMRAKLAADNRSLSFSGPAVSRYCTPYMLLQTLMSSRARSERATLQKLPLGRFDAPFSTHTSPRLFTHKPFTLPPWCRTHNNITLAKNQKPRLWG